MSIFCGVWSLGRDGAGLAALQGHPEPSRTLGSRLHQPNTRQCKTRSAIPDIIMVRT